MNCINQFLRLPMLKHTHTHTKKDTHNNNKIKIIITIIIKGNINLPPQGKSAPTTPQRRSPRQHSRNRSHQLFSQKHPI